jgi:Ca-activated chloride channel homolog
VRSILAVAALIAALALGAGTLSPAPATAAPTAATSGGSGGLVIVLDASGSMADPTPDGGTRIAAAQQALGAVIDDLPARNRVGMRVFGATVPSGGDGSCSDSQLLVPIGTGNHDALRDAVDRYQPFGETPIGYALQQAAGDLGDTGRRGILLVSDGLATCSPDPCSVAADLTQEDPDLRIDVIGFDVDAAARQQLQCVADRGRGDYLDVSEADSLQHALERLSTRAFRPFGVVGESVAGAASADGAPQILPGQQYVDEVAPETTALTYLVPRATAGSTIHVGLTGRLPQAGSLTLHATLATLDGAACDATTITALGEDRYSVFTGRVSAAEGSPVHACATAEQLVLTVESQTPPEALVPFELRIAENPWPSNASALPRPDDAQRGWQLATAADGAAGAAVGGSSLNDAPEIAPGSYTSDMLPSEFQFFRVPVAWGQSVRVQASLDPDLPAPADGWGILQVLDPVGADVAALLATTADGTRWAAPLAEPGDAVAVTTAPVRWDGDPGQVKRPLLEGEYIVAVGFEAAEGTTPTPMTITIEVVGEADGAPDYSGTPDAAPAERGDAAPATLDPASWRALIAFAIGGLVVIAVVVLVVWLWRRGTRRYV